VPGAAETRITVKAEDAEDLDSLYAWLRDEDGLRGRVQLLRAPMRDDEMGAAFAAIAVAVGSGGALTALVQALSTWLGHRRGLSVKVEVCDDARGVRVAVEAASPEDVERLLLQARGMLAQDW
jgi:hypothetical protein